MDAAGEPQRIVGVSKRNLKNTCTSRARCAELPRPKKGELSVPMKLSKFTLLKTLKASRPRSSFVLDVYSPKTNFFFMLRSTLKYPEPRPVFRPILVGRSLATL